MFLVNSALNHQASAAVNNRGIFRETTKTSKGPFGGGGGAAGDRRGSYRPLLAQPDPAEESCYRRESVVVVCVGGRGAGLIL